MGEQESVVVTAWDPTRWRGTRGGDPTKRDRVLAAVEVVWLRLGELGLTVRRLADAAGTTSQTIYTNWGSREALLAAATDGLVAEASTWVELGSPSALLAKALDRPAVWRMLVRGDGPDGSGPDHHPDLMPVRVAVVGLVGGEARLAIADGLITAVLDGRLERETVLDLLAG